MADSPRPLPELKSTAHLLLLEAGLFCVSHAADTPAPDPASGLPAVRLSLAPSPSRFGGRVLIAGFNGEGWLAGRDDAALVKVVGGAAQVLVTIYQDAAGAASESPKLQVLRLSETARAAEPAATVGVEVLAHCYGRGDVAGSFGGWVGERGSLRWVEGFALTPPEMVPAADIEYQAVLGRGWMSPWCEGGQFCGSRGMSLPILGLRVRLRGVSARTHGLSLSATFVDGSEVGPITDGGTCEAPSLAALEAFVVALTPTRRVNVEAKLTPQRTVSVEVRRKRGAK